MKVLVDIVRYPDHKERDREWIEVAEECRRIQALRKGLEEQENELFCRLKELSEGMSSKGGGFIFTKIMRKGGVDYSKIINLEGMDLDPYRKEQVESWKLDQIVTLGTEHGR